MAMKLGESGYRWQHIEAELNFGFMKTKEAREENVGQAENSIWFVVA